MANLPRGRYVVFEARDAYIRGTVVDSMRLKQELADGIYPHGTKIMHVLSGKCYRVDISARLEAFRGLTGRQKDRAETLRAAAWPNPQQRPRPRVRK